MPLVAAHPHQSGIYALPDGQDAFAARALLAAGAERTIDAQYYIWHADHTGTLLFESLWKAADRGVRVRLLLDDNSTGGLDPTISALSAHPNVEVRLFNPLIRRRARWTNYIFDFGRLNHRMHNKSFTVDNQVTVVGGRNIGDEYFAAGSPVPFDDLDVIAVGPVVREVSNEFDEYWNSASAYPAASIIGEAPPDAAGKLEKRFAATREDPASKQYLESVRNTPLVTEFEDGELPLQWSEAVLVCDDPAKALGGNHPEDVLLLSRLLAITGHPKMQFDLVSPYFVPRGQGEERLKALAGGGVQVRVLTNSLESTDVTAVHAGYARHRKALLRAGVKLFELRRYGRPVSERKPSAKSAAALHAKTFQLDGAKLFVGSFNFDPRSAKLNTEMGLVIESPVLAHQLGSFFDSKVPSLAYEVRLSGDSIQWLEPTSGGEKVYDSEPGTSAWRRAEVGFLSILPIESML